MKTIPLSLHLDSPLKWEREGEIAAHTDEPILWEFELEPHLVPSRILSYQLACDHFREVFFPPFAEKSVGAIFYRGSFSSWEHQNATLDFLKMLLSALPDTLTPLLFLEPAPYLSRGAILRQFSPENFEPFHCAMRAVPFHFPYSTWDLLPPTPLTQGFVLPSPDNEDDALWERIARYLDAHPCRPIPESLLSHHWEGIEELHLFPETLTPLGKRYLQGFVSAGGSVVSCPGGLKSELLFSLDRT